MYKVRMPFGAGEANSVEALASPLLERLGELPDAALDIFGVRYSCHNDNGVPASRGQLSGRSMEMLMSRLRFLKVSSEWFPLLPPHLRVELGARPFSGGVIAVALSEATFSNILSQQQMCEIFLPRMTPPAEHAQVQTVINGETVAKTIVDDDTSYVIQQDFWTSVMDSVDRELYVLSAEKFERQRSLL
ncbi:hypothetical protein AK812_SmicGene13751 [Symbiodinium microadriaticum]|uniref:Uncharacterized protein n=1 Tax=Symbiodinium microadriaticum TaxID=2951 RepID=A0A1Q9E7F2_SYMMI|nr:hypothetical protein AK812_SmicGene13751 [Symbiodinium microadriaticum]